MAKDRETEGLDKALVFSTIPSIAQILWTKSAVTADVSKEEDLKVLFERMVSEFDWLDIVISNVDSGRLNLTSSISAQMGMTKCLAHDFGARDITGNCIARGRVRSDIWDEAATKYFLDGDKMTAQDVEAAIAKSSPV
ncbi:hypothetical protein ETB97_004183 [Aspergillus alliaceus]|uniref:Uncharacterized protein n=1 Tax=Petromyces alliaceus TaxID=209559 RepID=A0A8H6ABJ3_PETAA|nr:hypothetical protein ETB97_004183 [Aspergillus burnettii]